ncbi:MAG: nucleotidyltransferase domain-containing protein [Dehalococcoidia bacterium]|nr:nucleotidyltransferase domain-containing protein [Dehalococcoidia bacterium]
MPSATTTHPSDFEPARLRDTLARAVAGVPGVRAAWLFGSWAEGRATRWSDVDLAVSVDPEADPAAVRLAVLTQLVAQGIDDADVVVLEQAPPVLRFEAVRHNQLVFVRSDVDAASTVSRILREWFDLEPLLAPQRAALRARLLASPTATAEP